MIASLIVSLASATVAQTPDKQAHTYASHGYPCFGMYVAAAGDVNGDGVPDLIVGDGGFSQENIPAAFWIVSGKGGSVIRRLALPAIPPGYFRIDGGADLDGDKIPDVFIVGNPYGARPVGTALIVSGKTGECTQRFSVSGSSSGGGNWARIVGDFGHDGLADVAVLCPMKTSERKGALSIYSGKSAALITEIPLDNRCGATAGGFVEVGDVDGDGASDFVVEMQGTHGCAGCLRLYSTAKQSVLWDLAAAKPGDGAYCALARLGDLDNDGVRDIAASFLDRVEVVSVKTGHPIYHLQPASAVPDTWMGFGHALTAIENTNARGEINLVMSETEDVAGVVRGFAGKSGAKLWETATRAEPDTTMFGYELATLGDLDGDGVSDVIVGSWEGPTFTPGLARVISGKTGALLFELTRKGDDVVVSQRAERAPTPR
jgi:hypothetical protein